MSTAADVADIEIHVDGSGPETILMIHGWPDTYRLWDAQVQALKDQYRCVRFTLPGFDTAQARRTYSLDELTDFFQQTVDKVSPEQPVILLLHDWGCNFGYEFYTRHPHRVAKIIGVDIGDKVSWAESRTAWETLMVLVYQLFLALAWVIGGRMGDGMTRWLARRLHCPSDLSFVSARMNYPYFMHWFGGRQSYRKHGRRFQPACPMLFIYGRQKPFQFYSPAWAQELLASKDNAVVELDTGHWVMSEQPERFQEVVHRWLAGG